MGNTQSQRDLAQRVARGWGSMQTILGTSCAFMGISGRPFAKATWKTAAFVRSAEECSTGCLRSWQHQTAQLAARPSPAGVLKGPRPSRLRAAHRQVIIFYYLDDDTMQLSEPRVDNSGVPQGNLIRRSSSLAALELLGSFTR